MSKYGKAAYVPIICGIILLITGAVYPLPGGALTTEESRNGQPTDYYTFDNRYSAIDEYVGGDAYNFIIGASLVAGKLAGAMISRSIYFAAGLVCVAIGVTMLMVKEDDQKTAVIIPAAPAPAPAEPAKVSAPAEPVSKEEEKLPEL